MSGKLGEILLKEKLISPDQLKTALDHQKQNGGRLGNSLVQLGYLSDEEITSVLSRQYGVPSINLAYFEVDPGVIKLIPVETARKYQILPLSRVGSSLTVAMVDPTNVFALDDIKFMTGFNIEPVVASESSISEAIKKHYGAAEDQEAKEIIDEIVNFVDEAGAETLELEEQDDDGLSLSQLEAAAEEAPVVKLVNYILMDGVKRGASDIHMEPYEREYRIRYRVDGMLQSFMNAPLKLRDAIISRVKIMARLDIAEKRLPQDGRIMIKFMQNGKRKSLDFRVSILPTMFGEKVVMRLLDKENLMLDMTKLGFEVESLDKFKNAIAKPYGMVLVTGPTGSGKTNTLYSSLAQLNKSGC